MANKLEKNSITVLLVEDDPGIVDVVSESLIDAGFLVVAAKDGVEATLKLKNQEFDFLITDLNLPKKDGLKLINELSNDMRIPTLLITGELENFELRLKNVNDVMLLPKPFNPQIIPTLVKKIIMASKADKVKTKAKAEVA